MDSEDIDALRAKLFELSGDIGLLQGNTGELQNLARREGSRPDPALTPPFPILAPCPSPYTDSFHETPPDSPILQWATSEVNSARYNNNDCDCKCRSLVRGRNGVDRGVLLGLVSAGSVADLPGPVLQVLDSGLKAIVQHLVPRNPGAPPMATAGGPFHRTTADMIALLNRVSLRTASLPGEATAHFADFRSIDRGRWLRLGDARQGFQAMVQDVERTNALYFETFLQLLRFRGIEIELLR